MLARDLSTPPDKLAPSVPIPGDHAILEQHCAIIITWADPEYDGGLPVEEYKVEVLNANNRFEQLPAACGFDPAFNSCIMKYTALARSPYNLKGGDLVQVRSSARNGQGWNLPSNVNTGGPRIVEKPEMVENFRVENKGVDSV